RDFNGANGLFGAVFHAMDDTALDRFLGALRLFGLGFSWGGYESLVIPCCDQLNRRPDSPWQSREGPLMRFHIGLEAPDDLIADLQQAFTVASCAR
ncbi:MAG: PLP-dependent transferase, partial [Pseudomonadota bacterium]